MYCGILNFIFAKTTQIVSDFLRFKFSKSGQICGFH